MDDLRLIEICEEIGSVADSNGLFTDGLNQLLAGRVVEDMTVGDLIALVRQYRVRFNRIHNIGY